MLNCNKNNCTCWFDSFKQYNWGECCKQHDSSYIFNKLSDKTKWQVDKEFFSCIRNKTNIVWASIMWLGQNIGSWYHWRKYKNARP